MKARAKHHDVELLFDGDGICKRMPPAEARALADELRTAADEAEKPALKPCPVCNTEAIKIGTSVGCAQGLGTTCPLRNCTFPEEAWAALPRRLVYEGEWASSEYVQGGSTPTCAIKTST